jgi:hypothetical protein
VEAESDSDPKSKSVPGVEAEPDSDPKSKSELDVEAELSLALESVLVELLVLEVSVDFGTHACWSLN